jgi:predicted lactoylglutathione lyase
MIGYVTLGTNDLARANKFYDALLADMGAKRVMESDRYTVWAAGNGPMLMVCAPFDGGAATQGNGVMVALAAGGKEKVDALYAKAIALGGKDEGAAGPRGDSFYAGYFRDPDGNKLCFFHM